MSICDLCDRQIGESPREFSAEQVKRAVQVGLRPGGIVLERDETSQAGAGKTLSQKWLPSLFFGKTRQSRINHLAMENPDEWIEKVLADSTNWSVCSDCGSSIDRCLWKFEQPRQFTPQPPTAPPAKAQPEIRQKEDMEELTAPQQPQLLATQDVDPAQIATMTDLQFDRLPFGVITVDFDGDVVFYNEWQSKFSGIPRYLVLERNFFGEIAPCTRVRAFEGRFFAYVDELKATPNFSRIETFDYVFTFLQFEYVKIVFAPARIPGTINIMVFKQNYERFNTPSDLYRTLDLAALRHMTPEEKDMMSYGVITLDKDDQVIAYNDWEARLAGLPRHKALHQHWFKQLAPCTRVKDFEGRYRAFRNGKIDTEIFEFIFPFSQGAQFVNCIFLPGADEGAVDIVIFKRKLLI